MPAPDPVSRERGSPGAPYPAPATRFPASAGIAFARCPFCGPTVLVRWADDELAVRCLRCRASAVHLSLGAVLRELRPDLRGRRVLELSSRGPLVRYLRGSGARLTLTERFDDVPPGSLRGGVRCEDVQRLSFADASFDLVTHTDVFEHVEDDAVGFRELRRVLVPGGLTVFSVPLSAAPTRERVRRGPDGLQYLLPPEYHGDRLRGAGRVLSWRDYGGDIVVRLQQAGFGDARLVPAPPVAWFGRGRMIVVATP